MATASFCLTSTSPTLSSAITFLEIVHFGVGGIERVVIDEDRIAFDRPGIGGAQSLGIGVHVHHFLLHGLGIIGEIDGIAHRLAHLALSIRADQQWNIADDGFGFREDFTIEIVEAPRHLAGQFHMRLVVASHGDHLGARQQNIHGLQDGIAKQTKRHGVDVGITRHIFERGHAFEARHGHQHFEAADSTHRFRGIADWTKIVLTSGSMPTAR